MVNEKETAANEVEWRMEVKDGAPMALAPEAGPFRKVWIELKVLFSGLYQKICRFFKKAYDIGVDDPRKVVHCFKVGMALTVVSLFYYMRPLYDVVGGNAVWAIMTVVVVFENTAGATISKSLNRICGTTLAAFLGVAINWIADKLGNRYGPILVGASVFLFASAATFSRFIPTIKARFDYGTLIFILTFSLVAVSGYRVDELFSLAHDRIFTIIIGTFLCILVSMLICPIWAGEELHKTITRNMDKLANSLECCAVEFFNHSGGLSPSNEEFNKKLIGYKCVLSSKATEDSMGNFARWEPAHGGFNFRHPWKQYLKVGASMRSCAYRIDALHSWICSEDEGSELVKKHLSQICLKVSSNSANVLRELSKVNKEMRKSTTIDFLVSEMNIAVHELHDTINSLPGFIFKHSPESENPEATSTDPNCTKLRVVVTDVMPVLSSSSLLIEIATQVERLVEEVEELAKFAEFKPAVGDKSETRAEQKKIFPDFGTVMALQRF